MGLLEMFARESLGKTLSRHSKWWRTVSHKASNASGRRRSWPDSIERCRRSTSVIRRSSARAEEYELLRSVCQILVEVGGLRMAWVGYREFDEDKTVRPVAQAGYEAGYLGRINITWGDTDRWTRAHGHRHPNGNHLLDQGQSDRSESGAMAGRRPQSWLRLVHFPSADVERPGVWRALSSRRRARGLHGERD